MQHDLISLSEEFPGLMVTVSLSDLLSAGRTISAEVINYIAQQRDAISSSSNIVEELKTRDEARNILGVSETTLWRWAQNGYLTPVRVGSQVRYRLSDIKSLIEKKGGQL